MKLYIVEFDDNVEHIFDKETFSKRYKEFVLKPPIYRNKDYWEKYTNVSITDLNGDGIKYIEVSEFEDSLKDG